MRLSLLAIAIIASTAAAAATPLKSPIGAKRTVRYLFITTTGGSFGPSVAGCSELVLAETVVRAKADREIELAIEIIGGNDPRACSVGHKLTVVAPDRTRALEVSPEAGTDASVVDRIERLHLHLGEPNGTFSFMRGTLPWSARSHAVTVGGVAYLDSNAFKQPILTHPSRGESNISTKLRVTAKEHRLVCATMSYNAHGDNFEHGGWTDREIETISVDDGTDAPPCP